MLVQILDLKWKVLKKTEDGKTLFSVCNIKSKDGAQYIGEDYIHQNCSGCIVPHRENISKTILIEIGLRLWRMLDKGNKFKNYIYN